MRIDNLPVLSLEIPDTISPSRYGWLKRCALRALYLNRSNHAYQSAGMPALLGTVIHLVREDFDGGKIVTYDDFVDCWELAETKAAPANDLRKSCTNYGIKKMKLWEEFNLRLSNRIDSKADNSGQIEVLRNHPLADAGSHLFGRVDALVLKKNQPLEIREYKSGKIYPSAETDREVSAELGMVREDNRLQLMLYGWLVYKNYGSLPHWMVMVDGNGIRSNVDFSFTEISAIREGVVGFHRFIADNFKDLGELAVPNQLNCSKCIYRFGCDQSSNNVPKDFSGIVKSARMLPFGNFEIIFDDGRRMLNPRNDHGLGEMEISQLIGMKVTITETYKGKPRLRAGGVMEDIYVPKPYSAIKVLI